MPTPKTGFINNIGTTVRRTIAGPLMAAAALGAGPELASGKEPAAAIKTSSAAESTVDAFVGNSTTGKLLAKPRGKEVAAAKIDDVQTVEVKPWQDFAKTPPRNETERIIEKAISEKFIPNELNHINQILDRSKRLYPSQFKGLLANLKFLNDRNLLSTDDIKNFLSSESLATSLVATRYLKAMFEQNNNPENIKKVANNLSNYSALVPDLSKLDSDQAKKIEQDYVDGVKSLVSKNPVNQNTAGLN